MDKSKNIFEKWVIYVKKRDWSTIWKNVSTEKDIQRSDGVHVAESCVSSVQ